MTKLYHTDIFIPEKFKTRARRFNFQRLSWTRHAMLEIVNDRYGPLTENQIPKTFDGRSWALVEVEVTGELVTKAVFRHPVDEKRSLVLVLRPASQFVANVITCWTNLNHDTHKTLDRSKYSTT